jgi:hypothetical protein
VSYSKWVLLDTPSGELAKILEKLNDCESEKGNGECDTC